MYKKRQIAFDLATRFTSKIYRYNILRICKIQTIYETVKTHVTATYLPVVFLHLDTDQTLNMVLYIDIFLSKLYINFVFQRWNMLFSSETPNVLNRIALYTYIHDSRICILFDKLSYWIRLFVGSWMFMIFWNVSETWDPYPNLWFARVYSLIHFCHYVDLSSKSNRSLSCALMSI